MLEVSPRFLVERIALELRKELAWAGYRLARMHPFRSRVVTPGACFEAVGEALTASVRASMHADESAARRLREAGAMIMERGAFPFVGLGTLPIPSGTGWSRDPLSGHLWPRSYFTRINFITHGEDADVKASWEISRFQWAVVLAMCVTAHPEPGFRHRATSGFVTRLLDWWQANPPGFGVHWTVGMEVAIRAINLGLAAMMLHPVLDADDRAMLFRVLHAHHRYLVRFPETSDIAGNHYLFCLCGVMFLEAVVLGRPDAFRKTFAGRQREILAQFEPDGLHIEHTPMYHRLCVEALVWCVAAAERDGTVPTADLRATLTRAGNALCRLVQSNGLLPVIGDSDSGQVVALRASDRSLTYLRELVGVTPGAPPLAAAVAGVAADLATHSGLAMSIPRVDTVDRVGPFVIARTERSTVIVRAGAHGLAGRAAHDHDDNGSPWVCIDGRELLVDRGCRSYTRNRADRHADLSSAGHNLVLIAERDRFRSEAGSISVVVRDAPVPRHVAVTSDSYRHDLTVVCEWTDPVGGDVHHTRRLRIPTTMDRYEPLLLDVEDLVMTSRPVPMTLIWHLAPGWQAVHTASTTLSLEHVDHPHGFLLHVDTDGLSAAMTLQKDRVAELYGGSAPSTVVTVRISDAAEARIRTTLADQPGRRA